MQAKLQHARTAHSIIGKKIIIIIIITLSLEELQVMLSNESKLFRRENVTI